MAGGGYAWWYLDALSADGRDALVVIAFVGSVFSPYYAARRRRLGRAAEATEHCALNVALYRDGRPHCWSMTERGAAGLQRHADQLQIGRSRMAWDGQQLQLDIDEWTAPWPRRLRGRVRLTPTLRLDGPLPLDGTPADASALGTAAGASVMATAAGADAPQAAGPAAPARHHWWPVAPKAQVAVDLDAPDWHWQGHGYLDHNRGDEPLADGFSHWHWARSHLPGGGAAVVYNAQPRRGPARHLGLRIDPQGGLQHFESPPLQALGSGLWGVDRAVACDADRTPRLVKVLEDGPFYNRALVATHWRGLPVQAVHESLSLDRFQRRWVQALLPFRMPRWHTAAAPNGGL